MATGKIPAKFIFLQKIPKGYISTVVINVNKRHPTGPHGHN